MKKRPRVARLRRLLPELPATLAAAAVLVVVEVGLRVTTLPKLARLLGTPLAFDDAELPPAPDAVTLAPRERREARAAQRVLRHWPFGDTCLRQALISGHRLRRLDPRLHVGVAKIDGEVRAHAWLVIRGGILDPREAATSYLTLSQPAGGRNK